MQNVLISTSKTSRINAVGTERNLVDTKRKWIEVKSLTKNKSQDIVKQVVLLVEGPPPSNYMFVMKRY
ncbi:hypothetical protein DPMN_050126 [Dreissena polymorpha]|uniref:Uncharacterized protein n=1 Tax=Dreissena polymorpha TaxID=45954 RepID=A0A9D4CH79_DREPO|nr:hypothetical protein DPMN_050126 [Dreissena polymorpha]